MSLVFTSFDVPAMGDYAYDWALVDVETSGLIARRDRVLSVAVITIGRDGEQTGEFSTLLNPGCDPGPVEVHGLTVERLRGAPTFDQVAGRIGAMLQDRVLVAHNAQFDYDFLAYEFARARTWLPVSQRLCTLALNRQVDPPTDDMKLGTLAAHYGVPQQHAHDALDDSRVLAGILRASLHAGRRVLVLGGAHADAAAARTRVVELGGSAAVNLSAGVTDVVLLEGGEGDRRMSRVTALGLPAHDLHWLSAPTATTPAAAARRPRAPYVMPRGGVIDLPIPHGRTAPEWYVTAGWAPQCGYEIDVVAFLLDEDEQVTFDEDFVFYGAPESPAGTARLLTGGPAEQTIALNLASLPPATRKVVVAAAIDGAATFGAVGAIQIGAAPGSSGAPLARATLDAATTERTMLLAEIYRRGAVWRLRAVGQGYDHGLDALARGYGVDIAG
ncbi:TerD family protein [Streptomyces sp. NBC_01341]|uniref:TerD family protein n=1 Tax=Streptomyces sp. NBC_01341 TaxID=2903831 RepID=UPI002E0F808E|nr:TerD family protein [Streptomyces sp. NBC_01341]